MEIIQKLQQRMCSASVALTEINPLVELLESNVGSVLTEATTAHVQSILSDQTVVVFADTAGTRSWTKLAGVREPDVFESHD